MGRIHETDQRDGVERITTGSSILGVMPTTAHCYRLGSTLVDAGSPNCARRLVEALDAEITHVVLTHAHEDHVGAAARLEANGARVFAPEPVLETLKDPPELPYFREWSWGEADPVTAQPLGEAVETPDGRFEVVATPGHSPDHVALFEPDRGWLFSGDAFLGQREEHRFAEELTPMLASLERMRDLGAKRLFPGHGRVREDPRQALSETIDWYDRKIEEARRLRAAGHHLQGIRRELLGRESGLTLYTGGEFSKANLTRQLVTSRR